MGNMGKKIELFLILHSFFGDITKAFVSSQIAFKLLQFFREVGDGLLLLLNHFS